MYKKKLLFYYLFSRTSVFKGKLVVFLVVIDFSEITTTADAVLYSKY